jgi:hypothetical protein
MNGYAGIDRQFGLWIALLDSQCALLQDAKVTDREPARLGTLCLHKAKPVYLSQLIGRDRLE